MRAHLTNCVHIWSLSVGLTKCADWSNAPYTTTVTITRLIPRQKHDVLDDVFHDVPLTNYDDKLN